MRRIVEKEVRQREVLQYVYSTLADVRKKEQLAAKKQQRTEQLAVLRFLVSKKFK
jgi:hypothetical protein